MAVVKGYSQDSSYDHGAEVSAFDTSLNMISLAKEKNNERDIIYTDKTDTGPIFLQGQYDFVFCSFVLMTMPEQDVESAVKKIYDLLKKKGKVFFINTNTDTPGIESKEFFSNADPSRLTEGQPYETMIRSHNTELKVQDFFYSPSFLKSLFEKNGFQVREELVIKERYLLHAGEK